VYYSYAQCTYEVLAAQSVYVVWASEHYR
jgi:hypothetical protein